MLIGLTGCQGSGKSTLAKKYAQRHRAYFLETSLSSVFTHSDTNIAEVSESLLKTQLSFQEKMIGYLYGLLTDTMKKRTRKLPIIADRTFLDIAAYTLAILPYDLDEDSTEGAMVSSIVQHCFKLQSAFFDRTLILQPGVTLSQVDFDRANRGRLTALSRHRVNAHTLELAQQMDCSIAIMPRRTTCLEDRLYLMANYCQPSEEL